MLEKRDFMRRIVKGGYVSTKKDAKLITEAFLGTLHGILMDGEGVRFLGFGDFIVRTNKGGHMLKNPRTGKAAIVQPFPNPRFVPSQVLRRELRAARSETKV
ncbi:MAG: HU family DNA-binding protein [Oscillospiraceae bacterium]|jgi:DNA-binding protein HU-beta|nr:HU family DNA-binding protein [Oscillospiraceae bacterium]